MSSLTRLLACAVLLGAVTSGCDSPAACPEGFVCTAADGATLDGGGDGGPVSDGATPDAMLPDAATPDAGPPDACAFVEYFTDADADGHGDSAMPGSGCELPPGAVTNDDDCDDADAARHPDATEVCNAVDDDCDGDVDDGVLLTFYADADGDAFGNAASSIEACAIEPGYVADATDCDDTCSGCYPGAKEACDTVDQDCDGDAVEDSLRATFYADGDLDGYGDAAMPTRACDPSPGLVSDATDCNDACATCNPGSTEICDGVDQDCDGAVDDGVLNVYHRDADGDLWGDLTMPMSACTRPAGYANNSNDCNDTCASCHPGGIEVCDGLDQNCAGGVDEGLTSTFYVDADGDGFAASTTGSINACSVPAGYTARVPNPGSPTTVDCFPAEPRAFPGQTMFFSTSISGASVSRAYDFDCDGASLARYGGGGHCGGVAPCGGGTGAFVTASPSIRPVCGESGTFQITCGLDATLACSGTTDTRAQPCR